MLEALLALLPGSGALAAIAAALVGFIGLLFTARRDGRKAAEGEQAKRDLKTQKEVSDAKDRMAAEIVRGPEPSRTDERLRNGRF